MKTTHSGQSHILLLDVIDILNRFKIPYIIIGAMACAYHGYVRGSLDVDALISIPNDSKIFKSLVGKFQKTGLQVAVNKGDPDDPVCGIIRLTDTHGNQVDLILGLAKIGSTAFFRAVETKFEGKLVRMAGLEDFIAMKLLAGGPKDLQDLDAVLKVSKEKINLSLLRTITKGFGRESLKILAALLNK